MWDSCHADIFAALIAVVDFVLDHTIFVGKLELDIGASYVVDYHMAIRVDIDRVPPAEVSGVSARRRNGLTLTSAVVDERMVDPDVLLSTPRKGG